MQVNSDTGAELPPAGRAAVLATLMVTQTFGYGTGLSLLGVLGLPIGAELELSPGLVFAAALVLYGCAALTGPLAGRLADRFGGGWMLAPGAVVGAVALALLAVAEGPVLYFTAWALQGLAFHFMLMTSCYTAITQVWGARARRVIGLLTLATGLCATVVWPLTQYLQDLMDWRAICMAYAAFTAAVVVPVNLILAVVLHPYQRLNPPPAPKVAQAGQGSAGQAEGAGEGEGEGEAAQAGAMVAGPAPHRPPKGSFALLAMVFALSSAIGNAVGILLIDILYGLGLARADAVHAASLVGIAFLVSRGGEIALGNRINPIRMSMIVFGVLPLPFVLLLGWSMAGLVMPLWLAAVAALAYGLPQGLSGLMRPALLQHIFGTKGYGTRLGKLSRVADVATAVTPAILAAVIAQSVTAGLVVISLMALSCCVLVFWLSRLPCPVHASLKECPPCP
jgi:MFS family permease